MNIFHFERYKGNQQLEVNGLELMTAQRHHYADSNSIIA